MENSIKWRRGAYRKYEVGTIFREADGLYEVIERKDIKTKTWSIAHCFLGGTLGTLYDYKLSKVEEE